MPTAVWEEASTGADDDWVYEQVEFVEQVLFECGVHAFPLVVGLADQTAVDEEAGRSRSRTESPIGKDRLARHATAPLGSSSRVRCVPGRTCVAGHRCRPVVRGDRSCGKSSVSFPANGQC